MLEQCINQTVKVKLNQEQYQNYTAFKQDLEALKLQFLQSPFSGNPEVRNHCLEYLLTKSLSLSDDLFSSRDRYLSSNLRVATEKLKQSESDAVRYRQELQGEKENAFRRMQDVERDRVTLKTENAVLTEKYHTARQELDDLKLR